MRVRQRLHLKFFLGAIIFSLSLTSCAPTSTPAAAIDPLPTDTLPRSTPTETAPAATPPPTPTATATEVSTTPTTTPTPSLRLATNLTLPDGFRAETLITDLQGPTQMIAGTDGRLWLAQLAGSENAGQGQVLAIDLDSGETELLLDNLLKPTGLAVLDNHLWLALGPDLARAPILPDGAVGELETILTDLPFNGRSNGTLTVSPEGKLLYETSGRRQGNQASQGSAMLWELDPAMPAEPRPLATGLKGAYAHTFDAAGRLWTTEIGDDPVNGAVPPDELNLVVDGADFGWPQCYGFREPARNYGGTETICTDTRPPVALFPPRSTPTSIATAPWAENTLLVALWVGTEIVQIPVTFEGDNAVGQVEPFIDGLKNPQHLLVWSDGSLLVSEFSPGIIYRVTKSE